ncbi:uncharacterized protein LOC114471340 [Gouania willdenowi]|uniref:uncharacterized protein LOC114471340 n=1 Tax=Gouania willdenowi TaxID=441366 RepID=UPI0010544003|nr:uncharacterized protein LOC114471340 [Gouania willdenowi]
MRPRSKPLSKKRLMLPTIREGTEETLRDFNEANSLHSHSHAVSSEDYLLSICHLAHPTFATRGVSFNDINTKQQRLNLSRHSAITLPLKAGGQSTDVHPEGQELQGRLMFGHSDPLEHLYGYHSDSSGFLGSVGKAFEEGRLTKQRERIRGSQSLNRTNSIPGASSPNFTSQRKSSCPQLLINTTNSNSNVSAVNSTSKLEVRMVCPADVDNPAQKQSLVSQWISECRSAWREARVRACMLPAIAEI